MRSRTSCLAAVAALALVFGTGCGKKDAPAAAGAPGSSSSESSAANEYSKPVLTEAKMVKFIESLNEDTNPFDLIFKQGGTVRGISEMKAKEVAYDAFAKKYGFSGFTEYMDIWGRVMVGQMQIAADQVARNMVESTESSIKETEELLKKPDLSPEMRKEYTESLQTSRKSLVDLQKPAGAKNLNESDLALVTKYNDRINAAVKKHK